jgi:hypothetical protein
MLAQAGGVTGVRELPELHAAAAGVAIAAGGGDLLGQAGGRRGSSRAVRGSADRTAG